MGFFSWKTLDTHTSIPNSSQDHIPTSTVYMKDNKGNTWREDDYEGYGIFGGKDYYELLAEMNGYQGRHIGIDIEFDEYNDYPNKIFPSLTHDPDWKWSGERCDQCEFQGYFY